MNLGQSTEKRDFLPGRRAVCCALRAVLAEEGLREAVGAACPDVRREDAEDEAVRVPAAVRADAEDAAGRVVPVRTDEEVRAEEPVREAADEVRREEPVREAVDEVRREEPAREVVGEVRTEEAVRAEEAEVCREEPERVGNVVERTVAPVRPADEL